MPLSNDSYLQSLNASRGQIDQQVQNTLAEVNRQRDVAVGQTNQIMPAVNNVYSQARTRGAQDLGTINGLIGNYGGGVSGAGQVQRLATQEGSFGKAVPLYAQGFVEQGTQRQAQVEGIGQQLYAQNDQEVARYQAQLEAEERQRAFAQEQQAAQIAAQQQIASQQQAQQQAAMAEAGKQSILQRLWESGDLLDRQRFHAFQNSPFTDYDQWLASLGPQQAPAANNRPLRGPY